MGYAPTLASVIVLKLQEFARLPVAEQARLKAQLEAVVALAIQPLPQGGCIVLDAPDAIAIAVLDGPEDALALAERSQAAAADLRLCIGVNHGAVKPAPDAQRGPGLVGDGLAAGMTLANAAKPGRFVVSRSFREALAAEAPERAANLSSLGVITDSSVRTHEVFGIDRGAGASRRRWLFAGGSAAALVMIGLGLAARRVLKPPLFPAVIGLEITPHGEVFLDGVWQGKSPPLKRLEVPPGPHRIEVRSFPQPPLKLEATLGSAEQMTITHSFDAPTPATPPRSAKAPKGAKKKEEGFIDRMRRELGI